jgi:hypothetical protein
MQRAERRLRVVGRSARQHLSTDLLLARRSQCGIGPATSNDRTGLAVQAHDSRREGALAVHTNQSPTGPAAAQPYRCELPCRPLCGTHRH